MEKDISAAKNLSLRELTELWQWLELKLIQTNGEMDQELEEFYSDISKSIAQKIDAYSFLLNRLQAQSDYMAWEAKRFSDAKNALASHQKRLRDLVKASMANMGLKSIQGNSVRFTLSEGNPSLVIDEAALPKEYWRETIVREPNREMIKEALKGGEIIPGASLEPTKTLRTTVGVKS